MLPHCTVYSHVQLDRVYAPQSTETLAAPLDVARVTDCFIFAEKNLNHANKKMKLVRRSPNYMIKITQQAGQHDVFLYLKEEDSFNIVTKIANLSPNSNQFFSSLSRINE